MNHAAAVMHKPGSNAVTATTGSLRPRSLRELFARAGVPVADIDADLFITDLTIDSRQVMPGGAFIALPGFNSHGVIFAMQAANAGARVVLWEPVDGVSTPSMPEHVALIAVEKLSAWVGALADEFFDAPSAAVRVAGVTGTNGKTTTAYVLAAALAALGKPAAYAGTLGFGRIEAIKAGTHTTPDAITVHRQLGELRDAGVTHLGIEVSSHALDQRRIAGVRVDTAVFTNLTHDHLDYHGTLEAYGAAKARLFAWPSLKHAVINIEDAFGRELVSKLVSGMLAPQEESAGAASLPSQAANDADLALDLSVCGRSDQAAAFVRALPAGAAVRLRQVFATSVRPGDSGLEIDVDTHAGRATLRTRFVGDFNVDNLLAVLGVLLGWGVSLGDAVRAIEQCVAPPGRMETFGGAGKPLAIVDYAHTPDALEKALAAARRHCTGKLICVFGCGGDRDARKRPVMGAIAERLADVVMVTDDNPRTEDGDAIVAQILGGLAQPDQARVERNRAAAIEQAIRNAAAGDVVLIAGKGHEDYQIIGLEKRYFSDRDVARAALPGATA